ncbi:hypothetical protein H8356DRAFT_1362996 [Neocallimastix lanati (nom. inval.)]|nr:hypothetical protein H8356DRAFT_1362996 [Neocallimastix sp. JGI-2020a]
MSISIKRKIVSENCPKGCPCCGIFACKELGNFTEINLYLFLDDLFLNALLGGRSISEKKIKVTDGEQRQLVDNIFFFKQSSQQLSSDGSRIFLSIFYRLMMKWYSVESIESTVAKSVDVEMIRTDTDSLDNTNTKIITRNNGHGVIIEEWEKKAIFPFVNNDRGVSLLSMYESTSKFITIRNLFKISLVEYLSFNIEIKSWLQNININTIIALLQLKVEEVF